MTGTVTLYSQTHFNGVDIPASPAVLATAPVVSVLNDVYFERMDVDLDHIDLKVQYNTVRDVDYIKIHNNGDNLDFYYRAIPQALAKGTTRMQLQLDALLTLGGAENLTYLSGWQERGHIKKSDDVLFGNIVAENWVPSQQLEAAHTYNIVPVQSQQQIGKYQSGSTVTYSALTDDLSVVVSNIDVSVLGSLPALTMEVIEGIVSGATDPSMYLPSLKTIPSSKSTEFRIYDYLAVSPQSNQHEFTIPNTAAFMSGGSTTYVTDSEVTKAGLEKLYSAGQLQLQASYQIPKEYVEKAVLDGTKNGLLITLEGMHAERAMSQFPYEYTISGYTVKNKKCFSTYRCFTLASLASGDSVTKAPYELYKSGDNYPSLYMWADPCSTGKPYCRFKYIKNNPVLWVDAVKGLQWQSSQIVIEGASGSVWNSLSTSFANQQIDRDLSQQLFNKGIAEQGRLIDASNVALQQQSLEYGLKQKGYERVKNMLSEIKPGSNGYMSMESIGKLGDNVMGAYYDTKQAMIQSQLLTNSLGRLELAGESDEASYNFAKTDADIARNKNGIELLKNNNVVAPNVSFSPEQNLGLYGYNYFILYEIRKSDEDLKSEDMYYQRFGYNGLHRPLTNQCFKERLHYNYVQAFDINLKGLYNMGSRVEAAAIAQLNGGVRVWRELPNVSAYDTN